MAAMLVAASNPRERRLLLVENLLPQKRATAVTHDG